METSHTIPIAALAFIALGIALWACLIFLGRMTPKPDADAQGLLKGIDFYVVSADFEPIVPAPASVTPVAKTKPVAKKAAKAPRKTGGYPPTPVYETRTKQVWPSAAACAADLGVTANAVYQAISSKGKCKGHRLAYSKK